MDSVYSKKYIKYKSKYLDLKQQGGTSDNKLSYEDRLKIKTQEDNKRHTARLDQLAEEKKKILR